MKKKRKKKIPSYKPIKELRIIGCVAFDTDLKPLDQLLYGVIFVLSKKYGYCFAHNSYFADTLNTSSDSIKRSLTRLVKFKHISISKAQNRYRKIYDLHHPKKCKNSLNCTENGQLIIGL